MVAVVQVSDYVELNFGPYVATCTFPGATTVGNTIVAFVRNNKTSIPTPPGWTLVGTQWSGSSAPGGNTTAGIYTKAAGGTTIETLTDYGHNFSVAMIEIAGTVDSVVVDTSTASSGVCTVGVTAAASGVYVCLFAVNESDNHSYGTITIPTTPTSISELYSDITPSGRLNFTGWAGYKEVSAGAITSTLSVSISNEKIGGVAAAFVTAVTPPPDPEPGVVLDPEGDTPVVLNPSHIISWVVRRGASAEITGGAQPGSATLVARNVDDQFNPDNAGSTYIDLLHDGTGIWWGVNSDGRVAGTDPIGMFGGRITDITVLPDAGGSVASRVEFQCEDALGWYGRTKVNIGFGAGRSQGQIRGAILSSANETRIDLDHEILTVPLSAGDGYASALLEELNKANGTRHFIRPGASATAWYTYVTRNRQSSLTGTADYSLNQQDDHVTAMDGWRLSADTVTNQQTATVTPIRFTPSTYTVWSTETLPVAVSPTRPFEVWVEFDDYVADAVVNSAYSGGTPVITLTAFGTTAHLTITVASGTCTFTSLSIEGSLARRLPDQSWVEDDVTSQSGTRGVRAGSEISGEYVGTLSSARGIAQHVVWRYATPQRRPTVTVVNWIPDQFQVEIGDLIAYTSPQLGVTARLFEVVGITHTGELAAGTEATPVVSHTAQFVLQECRVQSDPGWFVLDTSLLDDPDVLAY